MQENNNLMQESNQEQKMEKEEMTVNTPIANVNTNTSTKKINNMALTSFIFSLVGLIIAGIPCGVAALALGGTGLSKFNPNEEKGKGFAIAGIVIGVIDIVSVVINIILKAVALS